MNNLIKEPRGQTLAQCIFPRPERAMIMGVNIQTRPYRPKGFQILAIVIHSIVIIHDQPWMLLIHRLVSTLDT
ncbi:hypothetical protein TREAZ_1606 [Leadbettera azotonutricia ZAS-9]|uniref:Uncharacterized protein n=1 Tax=Leadbettera azotonutricia (strain ATCC BAA-888 / DSM 13862 / ZAS-9) TaxID=545695 RepID=F5YDE7_LEAAZ|nr:hypothetical protein TREAZ_1606 [Leadbettera azotonutricia ZAS-9]